MILVLNFKTYLKNIKEHLRIIKNLKKLNNLEFWLAVNPYFYLKLKSLVGKEKELKNIKIGLQNLGKISLKPQTGEIVYDFEFVDKSYFVLIGHSERYKIGENIDIIKEKINTLQDKKIKLLIFFSENSYKPLSSFKKIKYKIQKNLNNILSVIKKENLKKVFLVYEPWWAISTEGGKIPEREFLEEFLDWYYSNYNLPIFYGGSFNLDLAEKYLDLKFNGYVLGKSSVNLNEIKKIYQLFSCIKN